MVNSKQSKLVAEVLSYYRPKDQKTHNGSLTPDETYMETNQIVNDLKEVLSETEQTIIYHTLNIDRNPKSATYAQMANMTHLSPSEVLRIQRRALKKLKNYKEYKYEEKIRGSLESCITHYASGYSMDDMGQEAIGHLESRLEEKYGSKETDKIMEIMREAFVVRDYYNGKLNAEMQFIHEMNFSTITRNKLYFHGMNRLGDIAKYSRHELHRMGFGDKAVDVIEGKVTANGLRLKGYQSS